MLPADVRVTAVTPAPPEFDARFAALRRHYRYRVATAPWGADPLRARDTLAWPHPLDLDAVAAASAALLGEHDFAAFCKRREGATTVRELQRLDWAREPDEVVEVGGVGRRVLPLDGAQPGRGAARRRTRAPRRRLARGAAAHGAERASDVTVAPAHGLTLVGVDYPPDARTRRPGGGDAPAAGARRGVAIRIPVRNGGPVARRGIGPQSGVVPDTDLAPLLDVALAEAQAGLAEGGIPIGAALFAADGTLLGRGHNRRVQDGDPSMHAETAAFRAAGRQRDYRKTVMVTTLSPCWYCSGLVRQFGIGAVVIGESRTFTGGHDWLAEHGVEVTLLDDARCVALMDDFIAARPELWHEDIGEAP